MLTRRKFSQLSTMTAGALALGRTVTAAPAPDITLEIAPYLLEASPKHRIQTVAYNGQVPGPLFRMQQGRELTVAVRNLTPDPEVVHWHGLYLPSEIDGAMEEGTPPIEPGATARYTFAPDPAGFRWYHAHTFAGNNLKKAQYGGQHGFLMIDPGDNPARYDREVFLALHDWDGHMAGSNDGSMSPLYDVSTINGKILGYGEPIRVKQGDRVLLHVLNSSPTEVHWVALAGHSLQVIALDGNPVPQPRTVPMLRLAPAERVCAIVLMDAPGIWVFGEVQKHVQAAGMGIVFEYAGATGKPVWTQPENLLWDYRQFAAPDQVSSNPDQATRIDLVFDAKFLGHGSEERWRINGRSYPNTEEPILTEGQRYRLVMKNLSTDEHPIHLHRHIFDLRRISGSGELYGLKKDVVLIPAKSITEIEFLAAHPGRTLFHCHQQDHMDRGFMMVFRYA
jgi:FtsP/CotA-like multicopper oxidase with cupredoxin domain